MSDLIDRQATIDALDEQIEQCNKALSSFDISMMDEFAVKVERSSLVAFRKTLEYLPSVQPERKKGEWVKVHGYATPGGDPVWACSECGKGIHVYGIEHSSYGRDIADGQWVACPNCGAEMLGEIWTK